MDISVSHLNNRLSLQLPQELPLGLVFVVGTVTFPEDSPVTEMVAHGRYKHIHFDLLDNGYQLRCILVVRTMVEVDIEQGSRVRVGGHLRFDPQRADYYVLARDIERLDKDLIGESEQVESTAEEIAALLADVPEKEAPAAIPENLPKWVKNLAPEAYQQLDVDVEGNGADQKEADEEAEEALVTSISALLDQKEDVMLTPEIIEEHELGGNGRFIPKENPNPYEAIEELEATILHRTRVVPQPENDQDWLLWVLFIALFLLVILFLIVIFA